MASQFLPPELPAVTVEERKFLDVLKAIQTLGRIADHDANEIKERIFHDHRLECIAIIRRAGFPCPDIADGLR